MDVQALSESIGFELDEFLEMLELFIESGGEDLAALEAAVAAGDAQRAHEASHSLKGSAGSLGLDDIFELARNIDDRNRRGLLEGIDQQVEELRSRYEALVALYNQHKQTGP